MPDTVTVTRAQALLVVVGDPRVLALEPVWRGFLRYVCARGGWRGPVPDGHGIWPPRLASVVAAPHHLWQDRVRTVPSEPSSGQVLIESLLNITKSGRKSKE